MTASFPNVSSTGLSGNFTKMNIRIISPSGAIAPQYIDAARQRLTSWGHVVTEGRYTRGSWGRFAATDEQRISDLNEAFADPSVDAILCARGGYGLQRIIDKIHPTPKLVIGFSDITALHQLMHTIGVPSLHAIMCKHIATLPEDSVALQSFRKTLQEFATSSFSLNSTLSTTLNSTLYTLNSRPGLARGVFVGGNLSVLYGLQGTPYSLSATMGCGLSAKRSYSEAVFQSKGRSILFLEDIGERHYHIDRMMQNLRMSGVLANLSGLIVGQFTDCEEDKGMHETVYETILRAVQDYDYPVLFDFPAGHVEDNRPLWLGKTIELEVTPNISRVTYACK